MVGCPIDDGYILSVDEPVYHYVPELREKGFENVTIRHLLQMTSGINFSEVYYNPFRGPVDLYYSEDIYSSLLGLKVTKEPGTRHNYNSGDSQLLGLVLHRALKGMTITSYMQERLWGPLGMEYAGSWVIDSEESGMEKTFCCLSGSPVDFAKFGRLFMHGGVWNGQRIVSEEWIRESTKTDTMYGSDRGYQYHWHVTDNSFSAYGYAGQVVYVEPERGLIFVRAGTDRSRLNWGLFFSVVSQALQ